MSEVLEIVVTKTTNLLSDVAEGDQVCDDSFATALRKTQNNWKKDETTQDDC